MTWWFLIAMSPAHVDDDGDDDDDDGDDDGDDDDDDDVEVVSLGNVTCTFNLGVGLNLVELVLHGVNVEMKVGVLPYTFYSLKNCEGKFVKSQTHLCPFLL